MTGQDIINNFDATVDATDPALHQKIQVMAAKSQMQLHDIHSRSIGCHCECMGMSTEPEQFGSQQFRETLIKWGLTDEQGNPTI